MYVKTTLELDPNDKNKVYQCIKYWICELGELNLTLKKDLAKLKAFITEQVDEFRIEFDWDADKNKWNWKSSAEIANRLRLKSSKNNVFVNTQTFNKIKFVICFNRRFITSV